MYEADCSGTSIIPPASSSVYSTIESWLRNSDCIYSSNEAMSYDFSEFDRRVRGLTRSCCGRCRVDGPNVDVYYWPEVSI